MSTRTYLSIGDVLTLLREEFPDVTISKIRFLESQGLVNPERSPSGYRKFYEHDVERLRWVLRQQREHFLPLKVIRDRLTQEGEASPTSPIVESAVHATVGGRAAAATASEPVATPVHQVRANGAPPSTRTGEPIMALSGGSSDGGPVRPVPVVTWEHSPAGAAPHDRPSALAANTPSGGAGTGAVDVPDPLAISPVQSVASGRQRGSPTERPPAPQKVATHTSVAAPQSERPSPRRTSQDLPGATDGQLVEPSAVEAGRFPASTGVSGASLTVDELCAASGLSPTEVASLEGFGLIEPMVVAGVLYYDEEALVVAKLVADFGRYGVEPRHLRLYRNAVDREVGLVEQIVTPLLRQRNPEARQRALDAAADLAKLGQGLRASLLRRELRRQLGG